MALGAAPVPAHDGRMEQVRRLTGLDSADGEMAGGKGANPAETTRPTPPAIVVRHRVPHVR